MSFPLPINPENVGIMLATSIIVEPTPPPFTPADIPGLIKGWDFRDLAAGTPASVSGAWGTTDPLILVNSPAVVTDQTPDRKSVLRALAASLQKATHTAVSAATEFTMFNLSFSTTNAGVMVLTHGAAGAYLREDKNGTQAFRFGRKNNTAAASTTNFAAGNEIRKGQGVLQIFRVTGGTATVTTYVSDAEPTTVTWGTAGAWTMDEILFDGTTYSTSDMVAAGFYSRAITADEMNLLAAYFAPTVNKGIYVDPADGLDTNAGYGPMIAKQTLAAANAVPDGATDLTARYDILFRPGSTLGEGEAFTSALGGVVGRERRLMPWDDDGWTDAIGNAAWTANGPWTNVSGNVWTSATDPGSSPNGIWIEDNPGGLHGLDVSRLYPRASNAEVDAMPFSFFRTAGVGVRIHVSAGFNPNTGVMRKTGVGSRFFDASAPRVYVDRIRAKFFGGAGFRPVGSFFRFGSIESSNNVDDGVDFNGASWSGQSIIANANGFGNSAVDGISSHGGNSGSVQHVEAWNNAGGGIRHEQFAGIKVYGGTVGHNREDIIVLALTSGGGPTAEFEFHNLTVYVNDNSAKKFAIEIEAGVAAGVTVTVSNCRFVYDGSGPPPGPAIKANGGTLILGAGNTFENFTSLT